MFVLTFSRKNTGRILAGVMAVAVAVAAGTGIKNFMLKDEETVRAGKNTKLSTTQEMV